MSRCSMQEELLFNWTSGFGNDKLGVDEDVLGDNGTHHARAAEHPLHAAEGEPARRQRNARQDSQ